MTEAEKTNVVHLETQPLDDLDDELEYDKSSVVREDEDVVVDDVTPSADETHESITIADDDDVKMMIEKALRKSQAYTDQRIETVNKKIRKQDDRLKDVEDFMKQMKTNGFYQKPTKRSQKSTDRLLGSIGSFLHGTVDFTAYGAEKVVDFVTFGKAKQAK